MLSDTITVSGFRDLEFKSSMRTPVKKDPERSVHHQCMRNDYTSCMAACEGKNDRLLNITWSLFGHTFGLRL